MSIKTPVVKLTMQIEKPLSAVFFFLLHSTYNIYSKFQVYSTVMSRLSNLLNAHSDNLVPL